MIHRTGMSRNQEIETHVLLDKIDLMKRIKRKGTLKLLDLCQQYYDTRRARESMELDGNTRVEPIIQIECDRFQEFIQYLRLWLQPPVTVNFGEVRNGKNRSRKSRRRTDGKRS